MILRYLFVLAFLTASCGAQSVDSAPGAEPTNPSSATVASQPDVASLRIDSRGEAIPPAPQVATTPLTDDAKATVDRVWASIGGFVEPDDIRAIGSTGDPRLAWLLGDLVRFTEGSEAWRAAVDSFNELTGTSLAPQFSEQPWQRMHDYMIAWDLAAPPDYVEYKRQLFTRLEPGWEPFFEGDTGMVDWRLIRWGGVFIDDRELGDLVGCRRGCIPALDDPPVTDASDGDWYPDDAIVFAVEVNGATRAYPKNIMEVHEMVNDTLGGRRIGMPYCTLCGSAQAFLTDEVPANQEPYVLRTSGLLSRSNKVMYELGSKSMFDTFLGVALTGPLAADGVELKRLPVVTTTWGEWKAAHPETTIVAEDGGRGIVYPADPLGGRDDNGPIFPVGDVDPRLGVQDLVLGVVANSGDAVAFPVAAAQNALRSGEEVSMAGITLHLDGGGLRAAGGAGQDLSTHQSFWFAWSQFHPDTLLWAP